MSHFRLEAKNFFDRKGEIEQPKNNNTYLKEQKWCMR